jgi:hypothetical protein
MSARTRMLCWRVWLAMMALSTLNALRIVLTEWPEFAAAFPGAASPAGRVVALLLSALLLVAIIGLWRWRRWGLYLLIVATMATLAFDLVARGPWLHVAAALASTVISAALLWWNRDRDGVSAVAPAPR